VNLPRETSPFTSLSEDILLNITQSLTAAAVSTLTFSSKNPFFNTEDKLARRLIHAAARKGLEEVLFGHGLTSMQDIFPPGSNDDEQGRPQVIIAGSTMVQAILGRRWKSDIDVFCTWEAAPRVRQQLMAAGLICIGNSPAYGDSAFNFDILF